MAVSLVASPSASGATEVGSDCEATGMVVGATLFPVVNSPGNSLPISVPTAGIATEWKVRSPGTNVHTERLKVFRQTLDPHQVQVVAESNLENVTDGQDSFDIRIPVQPGDRFGVSGKPGEGAIACIPGRPGDVAGMFMGESPPGSTNLFAENETVQVAVSAVVEPDTDGDGYGDETQDECPKSTAYHGECPTVTLSARAVAKRRSIVLGVNASSEASVMVFGQVGWGIRPKPKRDAGRSRGKTRLIVGLSGGTKNVIPGKATRFTIPLPKTVMRRLSRLTPDEFLTAKITASATDLAGRVKNTRLRVKLKGQDNGKYRYTSRQSCTTRGLMRVQRPS